MNALLPMAGLLVTALLPAPATAATRLDYAAPASCPTEAEFRAAVAARGADAGAGAETDGTRDPARVLAVTIRRHPDGFGGAFQVRDGRGATNQRVVNGRTCGDVVDALAVVTAIALAADNSDGAGTSAPAPVPAAPPPVPVQPVPVAPVPRIELRGSTQVGPPATETVQVGAGTLRFDLSRAAMLYAGGVSGLVPSVFLPRYALAFTTANFVTTPEGHQHIAGLVYQLHVDYIGKGTYRSPNTSTDIVGAAFGIDICQSPHYASRGLVLLLCAEYGGGYLNLVTKGLDGAMVQSKDAGFGQVTGVVDAQYNLGGGFVLGARVGGSFTFGDIAAEQPGGARIFYASHWSAFAMLGAGVRF